MIYYLLLPVLPLVLVVAQITILDLFSFGWIGMEISLIVVIYAGFHFSALRGGVLSLLIGFFLDCLTSAIFGLYMFLYVLIFCLSMIVADKVYAGRPSFIASFAALCTLLEGLLIFLLQRFVLGADNFYAVLKIFIPQAVVVGLLSPFVFGLFQRFEVFSHVEDRRPAQRI
jgi:cell shape-determining protein MreD